MKGHVLLDRRNFDVLQRASSEICTRTEGSDWNEVATKLSRYGNWEFEDYREAE